MSKSVYVYVCWLLLKVKWVTVSRVSTHAMCLQSVQSFKKQGTWELVADLRHSLGNRERQRLHVVHATGAQSKASRRQSYGSSMLKGEAWARASLLLQEREQHIDLSEGPVGVQQS